MTIQTLLVALADAGVWLGLVNLATFGALVLSVIQLLQARTQTRVQTQNMNHQGNQLERILSSASTLYLGCFPTYVTHIIDLINQAQVSIIIVCDFPTYAMTSSFDAWLAYKHALERAANRGCIVTCTCLNEDRRHTSNVNQYERQTDADWSTWKHANQSQLCKIVHPPHLLPDLTLEEFIDILECVDKQILADYRKPAHDRALETQLDLPLYFWLVDGREAIFAVPSGSHGGTDYGFRTSDHALVRALGEIGTRYA